MTADSRNFRSVPVLVPTPAEGPYTYRVPVEMDPVAGSVVQVPLGPREVAGLVWDGRGGAVDPSKLRPLSAVFDCPPMTADMRRFIEWVAGWTLSPPGMVARMVLRVPAAFDPEMPVEGLRITDLRPERATAARRRVIELAGDGLAWTRSGLAHAAGVSLSVIDGLRDQGVFEPVDIPPSPVVPEPDPSHAPSELTGEQSDAATALSRKVADGGYSVTLLDGITGSGKTEVYFEAVAEALRRGRQVLILLPEIALTQAFLDRFHDRFGARPAEWHSDLAPRTRERVWRQVADGRVRVVAGGVRLSGP